MPINTNCTHCGKSYTVSSSMLGKRVRCKACQQPFTVAAGAPATKRPTRAMVAEASGYALADEVAPQESDWSQEVFTPSTAVTGAVIRSSQPRMGLQSTIAILSKFRPNVWVLLGCTLYAAILGSQGSSYPKFFWASAIGFLILATLFLLNGIVLAILRAIAAPQKVNVSWKDILLPIATLTLTIVLTGGLGYMMFYRRDAFKRKISDRSLGSIAWEFLLVFGVALMPVVMLLTSFANHSTPKSQDEIDRDAFYQSIHDNKPTPQMQHQAERQAQQQQFQQQQLDAEQKRQTAAQQQTLERLKQRRLDEGKAP